MSYLDEFWQQLINKSLFLINVNCNRDKIIFPSEFMPFYVDKKLFVDYWTEYVVVLKKVPKKKKT